MTTTSPTTTTAERADPIAAIADFVRGFSLEATRPSADDVADLVDTAPKGTRVYVSAVSTHPVRESIEAAIELRKAGFEPVPHLAVRNFATADELDAFLTRMNGEAGVQRALVIAGDRDEPTGDFHSAIEVIDGALQRHGIVEIGIAGYLDGHPRIPQLDLDRALADKVRAAETTGVAVHIVTQFCFDGASIVKMAAAPARLRHRAPGAGRPGGLDQPLDAPALRQALRARVGARACPPAGQPTLRHVGARRPGVLAQARAERNVGEIAPHFFRSAAWRERRAGPRRWRKGGSRSRAARASGSSRRAKAEDCGRAALPCAASTRRRARPHVVGRDLARHGDRQLRHFRGDEIDLAAVEADLAQPPRDRKARQHGGERLGRIPIQRLREPRPRLRRRREIEPRHVRQDDRVGLSVRQAETAEHGRACAAGRCRR